ncbi:MAG: TetR/AcrR family transcriptional regulator [Pseudonocardia sp.]|nr:TetR/AcrR family transcriptional regulator [Pseudonocardia sp.]
MTSTPGTRPGNRPGPKPRLTRDEIVDAAVEVGVERLSVAAVAARLGVAPGTLYRYVDGLEEIAAAAVAAIFARTPLPDAGRGWRPFLEDEAELVFALMLRYSGLVRDNRADLMPVAGDRLRRIVGVLADAGFEPTPAARVADAVLDIVADGVNQTMWVRGEAGPGGISAEAREYLHALPPEVHAEVTAMMTDPWAHVRDKVALVLDGVEFRRDAGRPGWSGIG